MRATAEINSLRIIGHQDAIDYSSLVVSGEGLDFKCHSASTSLKAAEASKATIRREMLLEMSAETLRVKPAKGER